MAVGAGPAAVGGWRLKIQRTRTRWESGGGGDAVTAEEVGVRVDAPDGPFRNKLFAFLVPSPWGRGLWVPEREATGHCLVTPRGGEGGVA